MALDGFPYRITNKLAGFRYPTDKGLLIPFTHELVEFAKDEKDQYVTFRVPPNFAQFNQSVLSLHDQQGARRAPELVYAKYALVDGVPKYLPDSRTPFDQILTTGNYDAIHIVDHTADGWIAARCPALELSFALTLAAYSVIGPPDFYPLVKQQDLVEWWEQSAPQDVKNQIWTADPSASAMTFAGLALQFAHAAQPDLAGARFDARDTTYTAIVGIDRLAEPAGRILPTQPKRESTLSYRSTDVFSRAGGTPVRIIGSTPATETSPGPCI